MLQNDRSMLLAPRASAAEAYSPDLLGTRVLALLDVENLSYSFVPRCDVAYGRLRAIMLASADEVRSNVIATIRDDNSAVEHGLQRGFTVECS